jgi:hypothetical protein
MDMAIEFDSNLVVSVLDLHFNQNKNYRQIAQEVKMSENRQSKKNNDRNTKHYVYKLMINFPKVRHHYK